MGVVSLHYYQLFECNTLVGLHTFGLGEIHNILHAIYSDIDISQN